MKLGLDCCGQFLQVFPELLFGEELFYVNVFNNQAELANARSRSEAFRKDQQVADQKLAEQLNVATKESNEKINAVATEVGGARKDIESTRSDLEATKGRLERASVRLKRIRPA